MRAEALSEKPDEIACDLTTATQSSEAESGALKERRRSAGSQRPAIEGGVTDGRPQAREGEEPWSARPVRGYRIIQAPSSTSLASTRGISGKRGGMQNSQPAPAERERVLNVRSRVPLVISRSKRV